MKLLSMVLVSSSLCVASTAFAAGADSSDARHRYEQGVAAFSKHDFEGAVAAFSDVYRATGETKHLWNLSLAEYEAPHVFDALAHLHEYVSKPDANPKNVERAKTLITELAGKVGRVVVVAPAGSEVILDGAHVGAAPLAEPIELDPDKAHKLVARSATEEASQDLPATGPNEVRVELTFPVAPPPPTVANTPAIAPPPEATHDAQATDHHGSALRIGMTVGLGVGALVLVGIGIGTGAKSSSDASDADKLRAGLGPSSCTVPSTPGCATLQQTLSSQNSAHKVSEFTYIGGGVLAAGALASWLLLPHDRPASDHAARLVPMVGPGVAGLGYGGSF